MKKEMLHAAGFVSLGLMLACGNALFSVTFIEPAGMR